MNDHDHSPPDPYPEEGGPCWCGLYEDAVLTPEPAGEGCSCHLSAPCWGCENAVFRCASCGLEVDEIDWPLIVFGTFPKVGVDKP